ncbi:MAG TPA: hypothetical protein VFY14_07465 [Streptomyces sp.]|nr:hypothetical protein [Streptomyces sp.]
MTRASRWRFAEEGLAGPGGGLAEALQAERIAPEYLDEVRNGVMEIKELYEGPFADRFPSGPEVLFAEEEMDELEVVIITLRTRAVPAALAA